MCIRDRSYRGNVLSTGTLACTGPAATGSTSINTDCCGTPGSDIPDSPVAASHYGLPTRGPSVAAETFRMIFEPPVLVCGCAVRVGSGSEGLPDYGVGA